MAQYCQNMIVLAHSEVVAEGTCEEVFSNVSRLEGGGLDIPQITQLSRLLKARGLDLPDDLYTVDRAAALLQDLYRTKKGKI